MEKEFIPYEQALTIKELGFDKPCMYAYCEKGGWNKYKRIKEPIILILRCNGNPFGQYDTGTNWNKQYDVNKNSIKCSVPTFSQAFKWFREKYSLYVQGYSFNKGDFHFRIYRIKSNNDIPVFSTIVDLKKYPKSYEDAELECIKKLIEIVKNEK